MNKLLKLSLMGVLTLGLFACGKKNKTTKETTATPTTVAPKENVSVLAPAGTPLMAIGGIIGNEGVTIDNVDGGELLTTELAKNSKDIIIAPLTAGAKLYIAGKSKYKLDAVITINNTYIISKSTTKLDSIMDLKDKKIIAYGANNTPDIALKNALKNNNILDDVEVVTESSVNVATTTFTADGSEYDYCLVAEPQLTQLKQNYDLNVLDLKNYMSTTIYQAGIFVNPNANQTRCNEVIEDIKSNITYLNANPTEYAKKIVNKNKVFEKMTETVIAQSIPTSNITFIKAKDNKDNIKAYYTVVNNYKAAILNGMVDDDFFR